MTRWTAVLALLLVAATIVVPALAPVAAYAATATATPNAMPNIPWMQLWNLIKTYGPMFIYFVDALVTALNGGGDPSGTPNPPPPPPPPGNPSTTAPSLDGTAPIAWSGGCAAGVYA